MLRWVILIVAVVLLTGLATFSLQYLPESPEETGQVAVAAPEIEGPQPRAEVQGDLIYDFGKMPKFDEASHSWAVKNTGEVPLEIWLEGNTTCSCTVSKPGKDKDGNPEKLVIPPGKSDAIELHWHTKKDLGEDYSQGGKFGTNDPRKPNFMLTVKGKVYPAVSVYPPSMIDFQHFSNEEPRSARIAVYSKERPDVKLTKLSTSKPDLIVAEAKPMTPQEAESLKADKGYNVIVTVKPGMPVGDFHEELVILTDHPKQPELKISLGGKTFGPISATPERVRITDANSQKGASKDVTLVVRGDRGTHFEVAQAPKPLQVAIVRDEASKLKGRYKMTVTVPPGTATGRVVGDIVLKTDHPMASEVKIPVAILITRSGSG